MIHLGIHFGHNATVAVIKDGKLIFCQSEERLNRLKNSTGFPVKTLEYIYEHVCSVEEVASATLFSESVLSYKFLKNHNFEPFRYGHYLEPQDVVKGLWSTTETRWQLSQFRLKHITQKDRGLIEESEQYFSQALGLPRDKIFYINHHLAHAYSAFPNIQEWGSALVFTLDGVGDGVCGTVNKLENGRLRVIQSIDHRHSLGYYYSAITSLMGMKSGEHEFKVMGLAPYADPKYYMPILDKFRQLIKINDDGSLQSSVTPSALRYRLGEIIKWQRFDNVAGAIQQLTEELVWDWVHYWIAKTGVTNIAVAGGVFMNVKACQKLLSSDKIENIFVVPSAADETTALGAAVWTSKNLEPETPIYPISDLYLGMEYSNKQIEAELDESNAAERYTITKPANINKEVARLLADNNVVARCAGRMEFGARALGNRSILANPKDYRNVELINSAIKNRDFWMPFTPSILDKEMSRYIVDCDRIFAPYMCVTFDTHAEARDDLAGAIHPRDRTARPQCVTQEWNPDYYELISEFREITGVGGVLNTSFNLHGEPNVCSPEDALHTIDNSGLVYLSLGDFLLEKRNVD